VSDNAGGFTPPPPPPSAGGGGPIPQRAVGQILTTAFEVYKANAARLITIVAVLVVPLTLIDALLTRVTFAAKKEVTLTPFGSVTAYAPRSVFVVIAGSVIGAALAFVMSFLVQAAVSRAAAQSTVGDPIDTESSYRWAFAHLWSILGIALLAGLVILGGLLLFVIPGLIFAVMLAVIIPAFVFENRHGSQALGRSWELVKGHFWHVLGTILLAALIAGFVTGILTAPVSNWFVYWIMASIGRILTVPFTALVAIVLYLDLRARTETLTGETLRSELARED
jgi:Membrane domain of glycerophosphoryl diester phosphodiesterase